MTDRPTLMRVRDLSLKYDERLALSGITLELREGEMLALIGPNGSGKSTLLRVLAGLLPLRVKNSSGSVTLEGRDLAYFDARSLARQITYVGPELGADFPVRAEDVVMMGRICHGDSRLDRVESALEACQALGLRDREIGTLSGGERQLVSLARAIAQESRVVLLDEALSRMDLHHQAAMGILLRKLASEKGLSFVLVSHDLNVAAEWSDRCLLLKAGKVVAEGPTAETLRTETLRELYPNASIEVAPNPFSGKPNGFFCPAASS